MESAFPEDLRSASFLGSFNSLFPGAGGGVPTTKPPRNARPLPGSLCLPPEGLRGAGSSRTVRGALRRRPIRPPQSGLRVGVVITIARRRTRRTEAAGPRHAGGGFACHPRFLVSPDRVGTVAARDRAWLCPTEAQGAGDGGGYCVW